MVRQKKCFLCRGERMEALYAISGYSEKEFAAGVGVPLRTIDRVIDCPAEVPSELASQLRAFMGAEAYQFVFESSVSLDARFAIYQAPECL